MVDRRTPGCGEESSRPSSSSLSMSESTRLPNPEDLLSASLAAGLSGEGSSCPGASLSSPEVRMSLLLGPAQRHTRRSCPGHRLLGLKRTVHTFVLVSLQSDRHCVTAGCPTECIRGPLQGRGMGLLT